MTQAAHDAPEELDTRRRRVLFRATHRGTREADSLLGAYVATRIARMTDADLVELEGIVDLPDTDLVDWLLGRTRVPPDKDTPMLRAIFHAAHRRSPP